MLIKLRVKISIVALCLSFSQTTALKCYKGFSRLVSSIECKHSDTKCVVSILKNVLNSLVLNSLKQFL